MKPWFAAAEPIARRNRPIAIIGAGLAGCAVAAALAKRGYPSRLFDGRGVAAGASGVPRAVFKPHISRAPSLPSDYFQRAFDWQCAELARLHAIHPLQYFKPLGVLQLVDDHCGWPPAAGAVDRRQASALSGTATPAGALHYPRAGYYNPAELCRRWLQEWPDVHVQTDTVAQLDRRGADWHLLNSRGDAIASAEVVVIANGVAANRYAQSAALPLQISSGQLSRFGVADPAPLRKVITGRGLVLPDGEQIWTGATHERRQDTAAAIATATDRRRNLARLATLCGLSPTASADPSGADWAGLRASSADRLPLLGPVPEREFYLREYRDLRHGDRRAAPPQARYHRGLYLLTGLGSRGATQAAFAGELLASLMTGASPQAEPAMLDALHPARFFIRALRRGQPIPERFA